MRALTAVVWVRRMFFRASSSFQSYLYLQGTGGLSPSEQGVGQVLAQQCPWPARRGHSPL